jgi:hypothetical protein
MKLRTTYATTPETVEGTNALIRLFVRESIMRRSSRVEYGEGASMTDKQIAVAMLAIGFALIVWAFFTEAHVWR